MSETEVRVIIWVVAFVVGFVVRALMPKRGPR